MGARATFEGLLAFCTGATACVALAYGCATRPAPAPYDRIRDECPTAFGTLLGAANATTKRLGFCSAVRWYARTAIRAGRPFPDLRFLAADAAAMHADLVAAGCSTIAPATGRAYVAVIFSFVERQMDVPQHGSLSMCSLLTRRAQAWTVPSCDRRQAAPLAAFAAAVRDEEVDFAVRASLAFALDAVARSADFLDRAAKNGARPVPVALAQAAVRRDSDGFFTRRVGPGAQGLQGPCGSGPRQRTPGLGHAQPVRHELCKRRGAMDPRSPV